MNTALAQTFDAWYAELRFVFWDAYEVSASDFITELQAKVLFEQGNTPRNAAHTAIMNELWVEDPY